MACQKLLTRRSVCFSTQAGRLDATPETSKCLASFMPVGDERSTVEPHPRCGGGSAFALPFGCGTTPSGDASSGRASTLRMIGARHALGPGKISDVSIVQVCRHPCSLALFLLCRASRGNSAPISRTDWRRSSLYRPAAELSGDDTGAPTDRARTIGRDGPQLCTQHVQSADRHPRDFRRTTLVVRAFRSRPLRQAESHVHDRPFALRAHREAAAIEHIQHGEIF